MNKIKFSHMYNKMPPSFWSIDENKTWLISVGITTKEKLPEYFIKYDTTYIDKDIVCQYPLPNGKLIVLTLMTKDEHGSWLWTTVRRWTTDKERYYSNMAGEEVEIVIT